MTDSLSWSTPVRLSAVPDADNNDAGDLKQNQMCVLDSKIVVVGAMSLSSVAIHYWAIDLSGETPVIGPETVFNSVDNAWAGLPDDPLGEGVSDLSEIVPLGDYTFGMTGPGGDSYNSSGVVVTSGGTHGHVASLYSVDPETLAITRDHFIIGPYATSETPSNGVSTARWGDKMIFVQDGDPFIGTNNHVWIVAPNGTYTMISTTAFDYMSAPVVSGNLCFILAQSASSSDWHLLEVDLVGGTITDRGVQSAVADNNWTWFGTTLPNGDPVWVVTDSYGSGSTGPVNVWRWRVTAHTSTLYSTGKPGLDVGYGSSGRWRSNVRDITMDTGSNLLTVGYVNPGDGTFKYTRLQYNSGHELDYDADNSQIADFADSTLNYHYSARVDTLGTNHMVALFAALDYGTPYGVYFSVGTTRIWRNLAINPSGEQSFDRAWTASNGTVETAVTWEV